MGLVMRMLVVLCLALAVTACVPAPKAKGARTYPMNVVTTVAMVGDIVQRVGGDKVKVTTLIGEGVDPHVYKPTVDDATALSKADVIFYSGRMLEGKMADQLMKIGRGGTTKVFALTELIPDDKVIDIDGHDDPHLWMDASLWAVGVDAVVKALGEADPDNAAAYVQRGAAVKAELLRLHEYGVAVMKTVPKNQRILVTSHDAFNYFGRAYGLKVRGVQGISTESEASSADVVKMVDFLVSNNVKSIFVETSVNRKYIDALIDGARSRGHQVTTGGTLFSDAMGNPGTYEGSYIGMLDHNITTVCRALGGTAPERGMDGKLGR